MKGRKQAREHWKKAVTPSYMWGGQYSNSRLNNWRPRVSALRNKNLDARKIVMQAQTDVRRTKTTEMGQ